MLILCRLCLLHLFALRRDRILKIGLICLIHVYGFTFVLLTVLCAHYAETNVHQNCASYLNRSGMSWQSFVPAVVVCALLRNVHI